MLKALTALGAVAAASILLIPTASQASSSSGGTWIDGDAVNATVSFADLDLSRDRDVSALKYRINYAARDVCGLEYVSGIFENPARRTCVRGAIASAKPAFDSAVAAARSGTVTVTYGAALTITAPRQ